MREDDLMYQDTGRKLTFDTLLNDPLTRLMMDADRISPAELAAVLHAAGEAVATRAPVARRVVAMRPNCCALV